LNDVANQEVAIWLKIITKDIMLMLGLLGRLVRVSHAARRIDVAKKMEGKESQRSGSQDKVTGSTPENGGTACAR